MTRRLEDTQAFIELIERHSLEQIVLWASEACAIEAEHEAELGDEDRAAMFNECMGMLEQIARKVGRP